MIKRKFVQHKAQTSFEKIIEIIFRFMHLRITEILIRKSDTNKGNGYTNKPEQNK